ncbi:MAG: hypothetical protein K5989_12985 [Lachnospiraceae bacterium]|nr:hypothetical protein [Lachnospiraceae bacterium]
MDDSEKIWRNRFLELYRKARQTSVPRFTDFLALPEKSLLLDLIQSGEIMDNETVLFGGFEGAEREMAGFGLEKDWDCREEFPLDILKISPLSEKFSDDLGHRDFLGALMNLGIERSSLGDIIVSGHEAYLCAVSRLSEYISENLLTVKHTSVRCERLSGPVPGLCPVFEEKEIFLASERVDAVVARLTGDSRGRVTERFRKKEVFLNGRITENSSSPLHAGDILTIRGLGKFIYDGPIRTTKKDRLLVRLRQYV